MPDNEMYPQTKKLAELLQKVGYSITHQGCGHYRIRDHKGNATAFEIRSDELRVEPATQNTKLFRRGHGTIFFRLKLCKIEFDKESSMVSIVVDQGDRKEMCFVSFYDWRKYNG